MTSRIIHIHPDAPLKPQFGQPCNGCGVCCLHEPCPLGILLSGRRTGACMAVRWEEASKQYRCGALTQAPHVLAMALPLWLQWLRPALVPVLTRVAGRWIAAGIGCDSHLEVAAAAQEEESGGQSGA